MSVTFNMPKKNKKGNLFLILFALPFLGVGLWMLFSISITLVKWVDMKSWEITQGRIINGGYETVRGDESDSYKAYGRYEYEYEQIKYTNDQIALSEDSDNIGDFHRDLGNKLSNAANNNKYIEIYVDPDNPQNSIVSRDLRIGLIGFKLIFVITFGGVGGGLIAWIIFRPKPKDNTLPIYKDKPWLLNNDWQTSSIKSNSKVMLYFSWGFAVFWNAISSPLPFVAYKEVIEKQNYAVLIALLFPLVGVILIIWAIRQTIQWKRFGSSPVLLDPFPGSINGQVGGTIDIKLPYSSDNKFVITIASIYSYVSGSGKNRRRSESIKWQDKLIAHTKRGIDGTKVTFRFDIPDNLKESDALRISDGYYLWRINMSADIPGININRDFEIPVYKTEEQSVNISDYSIEKAEEVTLDTNTKSAHDKINLTHYLGNTEMFFPVGRRLLNAFGGIICGSIFSGVGWFLVLYKSMYFFGGVFALVGALILIVAIYSCTNSLRVTRNAYGKISTKRCIFGIPVKTVSINANDISKIEKKRTSQTSSGTKTTEVFKVYAVGSFTGKVILGEGFTGQREAEAAIDIIKENFKIL